MNATKFTNNSTQFLPAIVPALRTPPKCVTHLMYNSRPSRRVINMLRCYINLDNELLNILDFYEKRVDYLAKHDIKDGMYGDYAITWVDMPTTCINNECVFHYRKLGPYKYVLIKRA